MFSIEDTVVTVVDKTGFILSGNSQSSGRW